MGGALTGPAAVDPRRIQAAYDVIRPHLRVTPVLDLDPADFGLTAARLVLKLEQLQHAGSFKTRGAFANLLLRRLPPAGVVAASGVTRVALVSDAAIRRAQQALWDRARVVAEPGAAAAFAALLDGVYVPAPAERVGVVISGANTTAVDFR